MEKQQRVISTLFLKIFKLSLILIMVTSVTRTYAGVTYNSCINAPKDSIIEIPPPANQFFRILCSNYGHSIYPANNWTWIHIIEDSLGMNLFHAQIGETKLKEVNNNSYFKNITIKELNESEVKSKWSLLKYLYKNYNDKKLEALEISAENNTGKELTIYLFNNNIGYGCIPDCKIEYGFILTNINRYK